jgi:hypothetical protein
MAVWGIYLVLCSQIIHYVTKCVRKFGTKLHCSGTQAETRKNKMYRIHSSEKVLNTQILPRHFFYMGAKENDSQLEAMAQHWEHNKHLTNFISL